LAGESGAAAGGGSDGAGAGVFEPQAAARSQQAISARRFMAATIQQPPCRRGSRLAPPLLSGDP